MIGQAVNLVTHFIVQTISNLGYTGVAALMAIESAAIPLPSEIIMPFAGFLVASGRFTLLGLALAGAVGSTIGSLATYAIGFYGGRPLIRRFGHWVFVTERELNFTERFFNKFGSLSSFLGRLLPVIRTFISFPAGIGKAPIISFTLYSFVGSFIWSYFLAWVGLRLRDEWSILEMYFRKFDIAITGVIVAGLVYWVIRHIKNRI